MRNSDIHEVATGFEPRYLGRYKVSIVKERNVTFVLRRDILLPNNVPTTVRPYMRNKCIVFFGVLLAFIFSAPAALVFNMNSGWKYRKGISEASSPMAAWRTNSFDDTTWSTGNATFYYGESLTGTQLPD